MRKWLSTLLLILSFSASSQTQPELTFSATEPADTSIGTQMEIAREALRSKDYDTAIIVLNNVLLSPQNRFTQEAQARIGSAYEATLKPAKAIAEYSAYIAMYPNSGLVPTFRKRILALEILAPSRHVSTAIPDGPRQINETKVEGSSSTYLIGGGETYTLISNVHLNGVFKRNEYTTRIAIRENVKSELKPEKESKYSLNVATVEIENNYLDWEVKLGRQSADYGVLSKYDGITATYGYGYDTEYTLVLGQPLMSSTNSTRRMYGIHTHFSINEPTSVTFYYNHQTADSFEERSAFGAEIRYFKDALSASAAIEYDAAYRQVNSVTLQAHRDAEDNRWFLLYDRRKSPVLYADKALKLGIFTNNNLPYNSVAEALLRSGMTRDELHDYIVSETSVSTSFAIGGAIPIRTWTIGGDFQTATMSGNQSEDQSTSARSISLNAFNPTALLNHSVNAIVSYSTTEDGLYSLTLLDSTQIKKIRLDTTLRLTNRQNKLVSFSTHYKISEKAFLELQLMLTKIREEIDRTFILGFRYEFL